MVINYQLLILKVGSMCSVPQCIRLLSCTVHCLTWQQGLTNWITVLCAVTDLNQARECRHTDSRLVYLKAWNLIAGGAVIKRCTGLLIELVRNIADKDNRPCLSFFPAPLQAKYAKSGLEALLRPSTIKKKQFPRKKKKSWVFLWYSGTLQQDTLGI